MVASPALAELIWDIRIENPPQVVNPGEDVVFNVTLYNSPASDENLGVIFDGISGGLPGYDYEVGGVAWLSNCSWSYSDWDELMDADLAPGDYIEFELGRCAAPGAGTADSLAEVYFELQLFAATPERPMVGRSSDVVRWLYSGRVAPVINAVMDVKPGSDTNPVNPGSRGVLPVAILATSTGMGDPLDFDPGQVDTSTVALGPSGASPLHAPAGHLEDVDGDGDIDLVLHFDVRDIGLSCATGILKLTGQTYDQASFVASDCVTILGCN